jgi:TonB-like protein
MPVYDSYLGIIPAESCSMRLALVVLLAIAAVPTVAENHPLWLELRPRIKAVVGPDAIDCGAVSAKQNGVASSTCVVDAFRQSQPFYVGYFLNGIDDVPGYALAGNAKGKVFEFRFEFGLAMEPTPPRYVEKKQCAAPVILVMSRTGRLHCEKGVFEGDVGLCEGVPLNTPASALANYKGAIEAEIVVHREGNASLLSIGKSDFPPQVTDVALAEVREWRFAPASKDGKPVSVWVPVTLVSDGTREMVVIGHNFPADSPGCLDSDTRIARP